MFLKDMLILDELRRRSRQVVFPVVGACVLGYFSYHTVQGERGLLAFARLSQEVDRAEVTLDQLQSQRESVEHRVSLLRTDSLDLDLLEEQIRHMFNLGHPDDLVILTPEGQ